MARVKLKSTTVGTLYCDWSSSQNVATNQSTITLSLVFVTASGYNIGPWTDYNGSYLGTTSNTFDGSIPNFQGTRTIATKKMTVTHNSDGTKTQTISWKWGVNSSWGGFVNPSGSFSITLPTIARASVPTLSASNVTMGNSVTIYTNRASTSFTHTIKFKFGSYSATIATGVGDSYPYPIQTAMASYIPNATSGTGTFTVETYSGSTLIGSKTVSITLNVPSNVVPSISGASTTEANSYVNIGLFVQNISKIKVVITASGIYGSTISDYTSTFDGKTYKGSTFTIDSLANSGNRTLTVTVTDSRGRTNTYSRSITVTAYDNPVISAFNAYRCDSSGAANESGEYIKFIYSFNISSLSNKNGRDSKIQYKLSTGSSWTDLTSIIKYEANNEVYISGPIFDANHTYAVRLYVADSFNLTTSQVDIETEEVTIDFLSGGKGIAFGKVAEEVEVFDVGWNVIIRENLTVKKGLISGETDAINYPKYHAIELGISGRDTLKFYEYGGDILFYRPYYQGSNNPEVCELLRITNLGVITADQGPTAIVGKNMHMGYIWGNNAYVLNQKNGAQIVLTATMNDGAMRDIIWDPSYNSSGTFRSNVDSAVYLGLSSYRWRAVYAANGSIQTSDRRLKHDVKSIDDKYVALFNDLKPITYVMNDGKRTHIGFISQDVEESMNKVGLTDNDFAGFCKDVKQKPKKRTILDKGKEKIIDGSGTEDVLDDDGNPEYIYSLRYGEFIALNTHMIQKCLKKIDDLQTIIDKQNERIKALENTISIQESE